MKIHFHLPRGGKRWQAPFVDDVSAKDMLNNGLDVIMDAPAVPRIGETVYFKNRGGFSFTVHDIGYYYAPETSDEDPENFVPFVYVVLR